jgi:hypothetical protein
MLELPPDITGTDGWDAKKKFEFEHAAAIVSRVVANGKDITNHGASEWTQCGMALAIFGKEAKRLFFDLSGLIANITDAAITEKWNWCLDNSKYKSINKLKSIAQAAGIDTSIPNTEDEDPSKFLPADAEPNAADDLEEFGFFQMGNRYYTMVKRGDGGFKYLPLTNFVMRVLFHIDDAKKPRRLVEIINLKGRKRTVDVTTDRLTSEGKFKEFIEGLGNYLWEGSAVQLARLKRKLFEEERDCIQLETLGYITEGGYYAFSNGIFTASPPAPLQGERGETAHGFKPVDENGIVMHGKSHIYIPSGNMAYARNSFMYQSEKKFKYVDSELRFDAWASVFYGAYGEPGMIALGYVLACLFSDIVFKYARGFPMLYFYGEGGSGKGSIIKSCMSLFGDAQSAITLTGKANTDKAKIRKFAQFVNAMMMLEEFSNSLSVDSIMMLRALWDRLGYERSVLESKFGTENVPINSGVGITGNDYPIDDPLLQRLLIVEMNKNQFNEVTKDQWQKLIRMEHKGVSGVLREVLPLREIIDDEFERVQDEVYKEVDKQLFGVSVTERMLKNLSCVAAVVKIVGARVVLPFTYQQLITFGAEGLKKQNEKRGNAGEVQKYFDCLVWLIKNRKIEHGREFKLNGNELFIRFGDTYQEFAMAHANIYRTSALSKNSIKDKLMVSEYWKGRKDNERFGSVITSCYCFDNARLTDHGINIFGAYQAAMDADAKYRGNGSSSISGSNGEVKELEKVEMPY